MLKHGWSSYDFWKFRPFLSDAHVTLSEMDPSQGRHMIYVPHVEN